MLGIKNRIDSIAGTKFEAVIALQCLTLLNSLSVDKCAVLAALVFDVKAAILRDDERVVARNPRVGDRQVLFNLAANRERRVIEIQRALLGPMHKNNAGKHTGADAGDRADDGLGSHGRACVQA